MKGMVTVQQTFQEMEVRECGSEFKKNKKTNADCFSMNDKTIKMI